MATILIYQNLKNHKKINEIVRSTVYRGTRIYLCAIKVYSFILKPKAPLSNTDIF